MRDWGQRGESLRAVCLPPASAAGARPRFLLGAVRGGSCFFGTSEVQLENTNQKPVCFCTSGPEVLVPSSPWLPRTVLQPREGESPAPKDSAVGSSARLQAASVLNHWVWTITCFFPDSQGKRTPCFEAVLTAFLVPVMGQQRLQLWSRSAVCVPALSDLQVLSAPSGATVVTCLLPCRLFFFLSYFSY